MKCYREYVTKYWKYVNGVATEGTPQDYDFTTQEEVIKLPTTMQDNTNCLTYVPNDIHLELNNGTLTLKAGSKVYIPNGFNSDGSERFDTYTLPQDVTRNPGAGTGNYILVYTPTGTAWRSSEGIDYFGSNAYSGSTQPTVSGGNHLWYNTATNKIMTTSNGGSTWVESEVCLSFCEVTRSSSGWSSINEVFNGFGYIGSTIYALPGVKANIPNGFNADGTYKVIKYEQHKVLTSTETYVVGNINSVWLGNYTGTDVGDLHICTYLGQYATAPTVSGAWGNYYNTTENVMYHSRGGSWVAETIACPVCSCTRETSGTKITSLTPYAVQPEEKVFKTYGFNE